MQHNDEKKKETAAAAEEEEEEETFRWLDVVRYAAAVVVGLLAVGVLVGAIVVVLRPDALDVRVIHGSVLAELPPGVQRGRPPQTMQLTFHVEAVNPSGRAAIRFTNIFITVSTAAGDETMPVLFPLSDMDYVPPGKVMEVISEKTSDDPTAEVGDYFVTKLSDGRSIPVTMLVQGTLTTKVGDEGIHGSKDNVTYTCLGITLGVDKSLNSTGDNVSCSRKDRYFR